VLLMPRKTANCVGELHLWGCVMKWTSLEEKNFEVAQVSVRSVDDQTQKSKQTLHEGEEIESYTRNTKLAPVSLNIQCENKCINRSIEVGSLEMMS